MARTDTFEQLQVEVVPIQTSLLRCNTSCQPLGAPTEGKASAYYNSSYMSKNPYELQRTLPLMLQAHEERMRFGSKASDNLKSSRTAKNILQKTLNKTNYLEVGDNQAAAAVLGYNSFISSHKFTYCFVWDAVRRWQKYTNSNQLGNLDDSGESDDDDSVLEVKVDDNGTLIGLSQFDMYLDRGSQLEFLPLYDYCATIRSCRTSKKKKQGCKVRRPRNKSFAYREGGKIPATYEQRIASCPAIPILAKGSPPTYPEFPNHDGDDEPCSEDMNIWLRKARVFVEYYSLLFLPITSLELGPRDPTMPHIRILPWNEESSWKNF